ncbi:hypothetical protein, partial [Tetragenococcus halophilus]|uniref:hypothetical protein n=1 Tax=Tetragenococcus halophilus TaxID=51669 RepID=UPI001CA50DD5
FSRIEKGNFFKIIFENHLLKAEIVLYLSMLLSFVLVLDKSSKLSIKDFFMDGNSVKHNE